MDYLRHYHFTCRREKKMEKIKKEAFSPDRLSSTSTRSGKINAVVLLGSHKVSRQAGVTRVYEQTSPQMALMSRNKSKEILASPYYCKYYIKGNITCAPDETSYFATM